MHSVLGICNLHDAPKIGELTTHRSLGAVTFLGRYGLMDFTLSNFSNSGIDKVAILVDKNAHSIRSHVGSGQVWINNTKTGFQKIIVNENTAANDKFNTDIANIDANREIFEEISADYVIVAPAFFAMSFDFRPFIEAHIASKADATVLYKNVDNPAINFTNCDEINIDKTRRVTKFNQLVNPKKNADVSLEIFIFNRETFKKVVDISKNISRIYHLRKIVEYCVENNLISLNTFEFKGEVLPILNLNDYVRHSLSLLQYNNRQKIFLEDWPIYTTSHNTPPTLYGNNANVKNSFIANGSIVKGKVINSILSRNVVIEEGAVVENSIIFTNSIVGKKIKVKNIVADKAAKLIEAKKIEGSEDNYLFIAKGAKI